MSTKPSLLRSSALLLIAFAAAACGFGQPLSPEKLVSDYGGDVETYRQLGAMTSCPDLENEVVRGQNNFEDTGDRKWDGYRIAADQRYAALGCKVN